MKGIHYVVNEKGKRVAVQIDLKVHGELWEDIYDSLVVGSRRNEPDLSLDEVKKRLRKSGK